MAVDPTTDVYRIPYERRKARIEPLTNAVYSPVTTYRLTDAGQKKYDNGISLDKMVEDEDYLVVETKRYKLLKRGLIDNLNQP